MFTSLSEQPLNIILTHFCFQIINMLGWKPHPKQPKPLERGSGQISMKDLYKLDEIIKDVKKVKTDDDK